MGNIAQLDSRKGNKIVTNMEIKVFNQPLGMGNGLVPARKEWVSEALAGAGLLTSVIGGFSSSAAARKAEAKQRAMEAKENAWYNRRYNEDYLDTASGQNIVRRAHQMYDKTIKRAAGAKAVAGGTDASVAQAKEQANAAMGDTIANIAAADTQRKANVDNLHMQNEQKFGQMDIARENQRAANITSAAQQASNALISAGAAIESANAPRSITGADNNSKVTTTVPTDADYRDQKLAALYGGM